MILQLDTTTLALTIDTPVRIVASGGMGGDYFGLIALTGESISLGGGWQTTISLIDPETGALVQKKWRTDFLEVIEEFELIEEEIEELEKIRCAIAHSKDLACLAASVDLSKESNSPDLTNESKSPNSLSLPNIPDESLPSTIPTPQSTTTSAVSTQNQGSSTAFLVDFPARISPLPENKQESKEQDRDFSESLSESFAWYDRDSSSWKTSQGCLLTEWESYSESFPRRGTMRNGKLFLAPKWEESTSAIASGSSLLPTPKAIDGIHPGVQSHKPGQTLHLSAAVQKMPLATPTAMDARTPRQPTKGGRLLSWEVQNLPTPTARDWKHGSANQVERERSENLNDRMAAVTGKPKLNVNFVEKMMGYPPNWTEVEEPITCSDTPTLTNGYQEPPTPTISPTVKNDSSPSAIVSSQQSQRSLGEGSPILPDELTEDEERDLKRLEVEVPIGTSMNEAEAITILNEIKVLFKSARAKLLEFKQRRGWEALGYQSLTACLNEHFPESRTKLVRELFAAEVERDVLKVPIGTFPGTHFRPLSKLKPEYYQPAFEKASSIAADRPTTEKDIGLAVATMLRDDPSTAKRGIVDKIKERTFVPLTDNPQYQVNDVVRIKAGGNDTLRPCDGYWGVIDRVSAHFYHVSISLKKELIGCKGYEVERLDIEEKYRSELLEVSDRIKALVELDLEPIDYSMLENLQRSISFTPHQMNLLRILEELYGIQ